MIKHAKTFYMAAVMAASVSSAHAGIPVVDAGNIAQAVAQVKQLEEQYSQLQRQYNQARSQLESITGSRNLGDLLRNPALREYLPDDMENVYDDLASSGLEGSVDDIFSREGVDEPYGSARERIMERPGRQAATDMAASKRAYEGTSERFDQVEQLTSEISNTEDLKEIAELEARLQGEVAAIQTEMNRLQLVSMLSDAERRLAEEERRNYRNDILSSEKTGMPSID